MICNEMVNEWLMHRVGKKELPKSWKGSYKQKGLELNSNSELFINNYGNTNILAYVGFVDLRGFSEEAKGKPPDEIEQYLNPFVNKIINVCAKDNCLVDKTIGDEVMFVLPELAADNGIPANAYIGRVMPQLLGISKELGEKYPFRIGLSFGEIRISKMQGKGFGEWTCLGESVNLAKRLHEYSSNKLDFSGAFGVLQSLENAKRFFEVGLAYVAGYLCDLSHDIIESPKSLKGISPYYGAVIHERKMSSHMARVGHRDK